MNIYNFTVYTLQYTVYTVQYTVYSTVLYTLTLAGTRHFAILHGAGRGGGDATPPRDWLLSELELRFKRPACCLSRDEAVDTRSLTRAPLALQIFHHLIGGSNTTPRLSLLLLVVEKNGKQRSKARQK